MRYRPITVAAVLFALAACARPQADAGGAPAPRAEASTRASVPSQPPATLFDRATRLPAPDLEHRGAAALGLALRRVGPTQRVLMIGAHPDDENTAILAELALGRGADVAYLSLTRGEGGQNLIGGELEEGLGLIRTEELLAARRLDGAVQFFTRAYDYGFSRSADEAFVHWPHDSVLSDVVAVVRAWKPDVIISQFTGTPRDGHGQHQAAGILAREAYTVAADPNRFAGQIDAGLAPHQAARFYQSWYRTPDDRDDLIPLETGALDPLLGRSRFQIAMASRSRHRSQDMGQAESMGPRRYTLSAVAPGPVVDLDDVFEGVAATLADRAEAQSLARYGALAGDARDDFNPLEASGIVDEMIAAVDALDDAYTQTADHGARFHIASERRDAARAALLALGVQLDVTTDRRTASPGDTISLQLALWNGGRDTLVVRRLEPDLPEGWWAESDDSPVTSVAPGGVARRTFRVHLPHDAPVDAPYFLEQPRAAGSDMYSWPDDHAVRGRAFEPPLLRGVALVANWLPLVEAAEHVEVDPARGELRERVMVLPAITRGVDPPVAILPLDREGRPYTQPALHLTERVLRLGPSPESRWIAPAGWSAFNYGGVQGVELGEEVRWGGWIDPPESVTPGDYLVRTEAVDERGDPVPSNYAIVDYPHIRPRILPLTQEIVVRAFSIQVPTDVRIAYVPGSGDDAPSAIAALGLDVDTLVAESIAFANLDAYDVILTGARAYEVAPELSAPATRERLERWVRAGGALIVQYNKYDFGDEGMALLPLTMARPHDRVTDETAPVTLLEPSHPLLSEPNRIGPADFEGWVQERGLYFAHTWDDAYTPLLAMADPGMPPLRGSLLAARLGDGWYVYTGLALFRQLPAGVPGAYRLLANLLALGAE